MLPVRRIKVFPNTIDANELHILERLLLPNGCHFSKEAIDAINCWESKEILACPGSGKTTVLLAKLKLLADQMPLKNNRGVCVLSHTNVAVDELKGKLSEEATILLTYPNYIGTMQTFVDQYVTFPYLKHYTSNPIQVVDRNTFSTSLFSKVCKKYSSLAWLIKQQFKNTYSEVFSDEVAFISAMYSHKGALFLLINGKPKLLAGASSTSAQNYNSAINDLLLEDGLIRYEDAYFYTDQAIKEYGDGLRKLLTERFQYVFIDEYQDCSETQRNIIERIFGNSDSVIQKIGDVDQAIYNNAGDSSPDWRVSNDHLSIPTANRYGQEIADVLTQLRTNKEPIHSECGKRGIKPVVFLYDSASQHKVIGSFIEKIKANELNASTGTFKAIGMFKNVTGLKIGDYWSAFQSNTSNKNSLTYSDYINQICQALESGNLYIAERTIRKLLCRVLHFLEVKDQRGKEYSITSIKYRLTEKYSAIYPSSIIQLTELHSITSQSVDTHIKALICALIAPSAIQALPAKFMSSQNQLNDSVPNQNIYIDEPSAIEVVFDTVYGVKGETHDATLYLETETQRGTDIKRIMPLLEGKSYSGKSNIHERSRKCVYVGFSRPRYLLCLALSKSTYVNHENAFVQWEVIDLTSPDTPS